MDRCTHLQFVYQAVELKCTMRVPFSLHIPSHLFKVLVHLPFTLFCACCFTHSTKKLLCCLLVMLWCLTQFFYQSFTFLFLWILFLHAKNGLELKWPYFSIPFFSPQIVFFVCFLGFLLLNLTSKPAVQIYMHTRIFIPTESAILPLGSSKLTSLPSQLWTSPVEAC